MRRTRSPLNIILLAVAVSTAVGACGRTLSESGAAPQHSLTLGACLAPTMSVTDSQRGSEPMLRAPLVVPVTTLPPGVTVDQVQVVVESVSYGPDSTILAWAGNGLSQCIYATDHMSDCSIVVLERQVNGGWQPQADCHASSPARMVTLPPMQAAFIRLMPGATEAQHGVWPVGTYRVAFIYRLEQASTGQAVEVDSTTFTIT